MKSLLIFLFSLVWHQTDWSGGGLQIYWEDSTRYFCSEGIEVQEYPGEIVITGPGNLFKEKKFATDNAVMIALAGYFHRKEIKKRLVALPNLKL